MGTLEQFTIWAFSNLHFDVALMRVCSQPVALECQLDEMIEGAWVVWLRNYSALVLTPL